MSRINARPPGEGKRGSRVRQALRRRDGDLCWICGTEIDFDVPAGQTPLSATRDHLIERRGGGRDTLANQRLAHARCNNERSARVPGGAPKKRVLLHLKFGEFEVILIKRYHWPRSSSGLGRRSLTPVTGVRISSGAQKGR